MNNNCDSSSKEVKDVISYTETTVGTNDDVKVTIKSNEQESSELVVERFSHEEIDLLNHAITSFKTKLFCRV